MHNFIKVSNAMPKFRKKLKIKFQEKAQTGRRADRHYFIGPFQLLLVVQKENYHQQRVKH